MNSKIYEYIVQLLIVMIGVFLGMMASDWNESKNLNHTRIEVLKSVRTELNENAEALKKVVEYRKMFHKSMDSLQVLLTPEIKQEKFYDRSFQERLPNWRGLRGGNLNDSMFETARYSNVLPGMDIELVKELSRVYKYQKQYNTVHEKLLDKVFQVNSQTKYIDVLNVIDLIEQDLFGFEIVLIKELEKLIISIDSAI